MRSDGGVLDGRARIAAEPHRSLEELLGVPSCSSSSAAAAGHLDIAFGVKPGIDLDRLKQLVDELEAEERARSLRRGLRALPRAALGQSHRVTA